MYKFQVPGLLSSLDDCAVSYSSSRLAEKSQSVHQAEHSMSADGFFAAIERSQNKEFRPLSSMESDAGNSISKYMLLRQCFEFKFTCVLQDRQLSDGALADVAEVLNAGRNIVVICGASSQEAHCEVQLAAERLKCIIAYLPGYVNEMPSKSSINILSLGDEPTRSILTECATILVLGTELGAWGGGHEKMIIQIDPDSAHSKCLHRVDVIVAGMIRETIDALLPLLKVRFDTSFRDKCISAFCKLSSSNR